MRKLTVYPERRHQTLDNFGASMAWWMDPVGERYPEAVREDMARLLFDQQHGIGLSCVRMNLGGGSKWYDTEAIVNWERRSACFQHGPGSAYDWSQHAGQQDFLRRAKAHGVEKTLAFVNTPPVWLTENGHGRADADSCATTNLRYGQEAAFARYLADVLTHFRDIGLPFDYVSPINEPENAWDTPNQEGCRYANQDIVRCVRAVRAALDEAGLDTGLIILENANLYHLPDYDQLPEELQRKLLSEGYRFGGKYFEHMREVFNLPEIREAVLPIVASHSYTSEYREHLIPWRQPVKAAMARYPGYTYWMSEFCLDTPRRDLGMEHALKLARTVHFDLAHLDAAAWQWWTMVSGCDWTDGLLYIDYPEDGDFTNASFHTSKMLWALGHYSRFLRPGSVRVELQGADDPDGLMATAYLDAQGRPVVVAVNMGEQETLQIEGFPAPAWSLHVTSDAPGDDLRAIPAQPADDSFIIPARSCVTFVSAAAT